MAKKAETEDKSGPITLPDIELGEINFAVVGTSPLIFNRVAMKARGQLLFPSGKKNAAEKATSMKHDPVEEFRNSIYRNSGDERETRLCLPAPAFKGVLATAALDLPGVARTVIGRLTWVKDIYVDVWGIPRLFMSVVRSADQARTPDIRTRALCAEWCCVVSIGYVRPRLTARAVGQLLVAGGMTIGVGDYRQEKGKGSYGQFRICEATDPTFVRLQRDAGRAAQDEALEACVCYDAETQELLSWFNDEVVKRGRQAEEKPKPKRRTRVEIDNEEVHP